MSSDSDEDFGFRSENQDARDGNPIARFFAAVWGLILKINRKVRIVMSIVLVTFVIIMLLSAFRPEAQKQEVPETVVKVEVVEVSTTDYPILVNTSGTVQADTRGNLVSQIRGEIVGVSDNFKTGGVFQKGDVLISVDQRDYQAALSQAIASLSQAEAAYRQEQANARQAIADWERLGNTGRIPDLVARKPQLSAAKAQVDSARANFETAKLNLERTQITAPYTGRVIRRDAVLGQYIGIGTVLAEIFATDGVEVRLPLSQDEYAQLGLDTYGMNNPDKPFPVTVRSRVGTNEYTWDAFVTRTDSTFDLSTRQIDVIATVVDPFSSDGNKPPLKIGQFVNATIQGQTVSDVFVVPNKALREGNYVFVSDDLILKKAPVSVIWQDDQNALIRSGLSNGDLVVTTSLNSTLAGATVKLPEAINKAPAGVDSLQAPVEENAQAPVIEPSQTENGTSNDDVPSEDDAMSDTVETSDDSLESSAPSEAANVSADSTAVQN